MDKQTKEKETSSAAAPVKKSGEGNRFGISVSHIPPSTEKVSVNMNIATLAQIDLLVDQGHYSNRSDFINYAVRQALEQHQAILNRIIDQQAEPEKNWFLGIYRLGKEELEQARQKGRKLKIRGYGLLILDEACDELILASVEEIHVRGKILCSSRIRNTFGL